VSECECGFGCVCVCVFVRGLEGVIVTVVF